MSIGIEKIRVYPTALQLNLETLAEARGYDAAYLRRELMVERRGVNPPWEDPVTMAVNAARPMLTPEDAASIGLLIVASESGLDQEKALSSWVLGNLNLPAACRHFEIKIACYAGTAALRMAMAWLSSPLAGKGQKALVICTDESLISIGMPWEYNSGGGAVAVLISRQPEFLAYEEDRFGVFAHDVTDVIRPLPWLEMANNEVSLFSYMEALAGSYENYREKAGDIDFAAWFDHLVYHVPFAGISFRAHKTLMSIHTRASKAEIVRDFERRVRPSLRYAARMGATYGGSIFVALLGLVDGGDVKPGERIGIYSYGSGSCAEFYSAVVGEKSKAVARSAGLEESIEARMELTVAQYETIEKARDADRRQGDHELDLNLIPGLYEERYAGKGLLVCKGVKDFCRRYEFS